MATETNKTNYPPVKQPVEKGLEIFQIPTYKNPPPMPSVKPAKPDDK